MIDIETEVFDGCVSAVEASYPDIVATSRNLDAPAEFPAVSIVESNSITDSGRIDSSSSDRGDIVTYDVKCYSSLRTGAKAQAKDIAQLIDAYMTSMNFTRTYRSQGETARDSSVYQVYSRYLAGVDEKNRLYRR